MTEELTEFHQEEFWRLADGEQVVGTVYTSPTVTTFVVDGQKIDSLSPPWATTNEARYDHDQRVLEAAGYTEDRPKKATGDAVASDRIAKALESIADSLVKIANPLIEGPTDSKSGAWEGASTTTDQVRYPGFMREKAEHGHCAHVYERLPRGGDGMIAFCRKCGALLSSKAPTHG